jgi:hypothetical protein
MFIEKIQLILIRTLRTKFSVARFKQSEIEGVSAVCRRKMTALRFGTSLTCPSPAMAFLPSGKQLWLGSRFRTFRMTLHAKEKCHAN